MKKVVIIIAAILIILVAGGLFFFFQYTASPGYSVLAILKSVKENNWDDFQKYVDIEELSHNVIDDVAEFAGDKGRGGPLGGIIARGLGEIFEDDIEKMIHEKLKEFVENAGKDNEVDETLRKQLRENSSIKCSSIEGDIASVELFIKDGENEFTFKLKMRKKDKENYWQLIDITNLDEVIKAVMNMK